MSRLSLRDFSKYLNVTLPEDEIPSNALRRARGVHSVKTNSIRSRWGSTLQIAESVLSLIVYNGVLYYFTGTALKTGGTSLKAISGSTLSFAAYPPTSGKADYLFVSNGDALWKVASDNTVTAWGITAPADGFTATKQTPYSRTIDLFEDPGMTGRWSATSCSIAADTTHFVEGSQSVAVTIAASTTGSIKQNVTVDLSTFSNSAASTDADYISFYVYMDTTNLSSFTITFSLGDTNFNSNTLSYSSVYNPSSSSTSSSAVSSATGIASTDEVYTETEWDEARILNILRQTDSELVRVVFTSKLNKIRAQMQQASVAYGAAVWQEIRIAKSSFSRVGSGAYDWSDVQGVRFDITTNSNGALTLNLDNLRCFGGVGMQGAYAYRITYYNENTGSRSNPNSTSVTVSSVLRQPVKLESLPVPTDTQVTHVEIWRTVGDGSVPFYCGAVAVGVTTFTDTVADTYILDPSDDATYLTSTALEFDNIVPSSTLGYCCVWRSIATMFWTERSAALTGNLYYSLTGEVESSEGFIRVSHTDDPLQIPVEWNSFIYVFSKGALFQITGTNPYYSKSITGVPGTPYPDTVVPTSHGIFYQAMPGMGILLFDGTRSNRVGWSSLGKILSGDSSENLSSFTGTCATFARGEYIISDGSQTLAYNVADDTWRDLGVGYNCLYTDPSTGYTYGGNANGIYRLDVPSTYDDGGTAIPFSMQTKQVRLDVDKEVMVNHLFIDANTGGQSLSARLITDRGEEVLGIVNTSSRSVTTFSIGKSYNRIGLRLTGDLTAQVEVFGIELDVDISESVLKDKYYKNLAGN